MARERLLVMNGSRILQTEQKPNEWLNAKVMANSEGLKSGFYNIYSARQPTEASTYDGQVIHTNKSSVYQQTAKGVIAHPATAFAERPAVGDYYKVTYSNGQGRAEKSLAQSHTRSRGL